MKVTCGQSSPVHRRGTALVLAILLSVVVTAMVMCLALTASIQSSTSAALVKSDAAFYAAEYAMQDTLWRFKNDNTYRATTASPRTFNLTLNGSTYNCAVSCIESVGFPTIEWKFNEGTGGTAADNSGNGNNGTLYNCSWNSNAREGASCLYLNGTDSYINCGSSPSTNLSGNVTMAAWIKLTNASYDQKIGGNQNGSYGGYKFYIYNSKVIFEVRSADNTSTRNKNQPGGTVLAVNTWYHVAGLYSETNHWIKTYVNGQEEVTRRMTGLPPNALATTSPQFVIGREPFANLYYFGGLIDDVRVYNSEQTDAQIEAMYNSAVEVHATATLAGTKYKGTAGVTAGVPLPAPPTLPVITAKKNLTLNNCTITGDVYAAANLSGTGTASTVNGDIVYAGTYSPAGKITQPNPSENTATSGSVTVPVPDYTTINAQAGQTYTGNQNGTTFKFTDLGGNKVIRVNGDVTNPQFDLTSGVFPSGGTLIINGKLIINTATTIGNSTNGVYIITTDDINQTAALTVYGGLYGGKKWNRVAANIYGPTVIQDNITDNAGAASVFSTNTVPWFDPRVISYNGSAAMPMEYSSFYVDNN
jgi:Tfp pilus assembly protein PilX